VSGIGARGHKGKGGHVNKKGKKNFDYAIMFIGRMSTPSLINMDLQSRMKRRSQKRFT
jgi:hypothetical protein